jgi:hypothetical protein
VRAVVNPFGRQRRQHGLSLLEVMLLALVLSGALAAGFVALKARDASNAALRQATQLADADRLLVGFAAVHHRLPCPDTNRDGVEDCAGAAQKGWLPYRTIGLEGTGNAAGAGSLRYLVQRSAVDLAVAADTWQPIAFENNDVKYQGVRSYTPAAISTPDLCGKLRSGAQATGVAASHAQLSSTPVRAVAYALAHPGRGDESGRGDLFDAGNDLAGNSLNPPESGTSASLRDDRVVARDYDSLSLALDCARLMASLNMLSLATEVVEEVESQEKSNALMATVLTAVNLVKTGLAVYKVTAAATQLITSATLLSSATATLTAAIATCAVLVGCAEIPHATASVVAATIAVAASTAAVVASGIGAGLTATASALTLSAAIMAGVSATSNMDISDAVKDVAKAKEEATAKKNAAYATWQKAVTDEADLLAQKDAAVSNVYNTAHAIVAAANLAGNPDGTAPLDSLDPKVTEVINKAADSVVALNNYADAREAYDNAVRLGKDEIPGQTEEAKKALQAMQDAIDKEPDEVRRAALVAARDAAQANIVSAPGNAQQRAQLAAQISSLDAQIAALNAQIANNPADASLVTRRDQLVVLRADTQAQLAKLSPDLAAALAHRQAMDTLRSQAASAYSNAYSAAVAAAKLPYRVVTCVNVKGKQECTEAWYVYDGSPTMDSALRALFGDGNNGVYSHWQARKVNTQAAKAAYDQAVTNEQQAINAYNNISSISSGTSVIGSFFPNWNGAEAILIWADRKGGMR